MTAPIVIPGRETSIGVQLSPLVDSCTADIADIRVFVPLTREFEIVGYTQRYTDVEIPAAWVSTDKVIVLGYSSPGY